MAGSTDRDGLDGMLSSLVPNTLDLERLRLLAVFRQKAAASRRLSSFAVLAAGALVLASSVAAVVLPETRPLLWLSLGSAAAAIAAAFPARAGYARSDSRFRAAVAGLGMPELDADADRLAEEITAS